MKAIPRNIRLFGATFALLAASTALACVCMDMGQFQDYAQVHPVIVRGVVETHEEPLSNMPGTYKTMSVNVLGVVKGSFPHDSFEFFGDTGMSCLRYITEDAFPVGSEHLFILESDAEIQPLLVCGESSVLIEGDTVTGFMRGAERPGSYTMPLKDILGIIRSHVAEESF